MIPWKSKTRYLKYFPLGGAAPGFHTLSSALSFRRHSQLLIIPVMVGNLMLKFSITFTSN